jgi:sporulation protein YlmC with PRC-barrel domain
MGHVSNAILHYKDLDVCGLVIVRGDTEEELDVEEKYELILPIEYIEEIKDENVILNTPMNQINTVRCDEIAEKDEIMNFTDLQKLPIYDHHNNNVGHINDIIFLDKPLVELTIDSTFFVDNESRHGFPTHLIYASNINELDVSKIDIHLKVSEKEIERRLKLTMNSQYNLLYEDSPMKEMGDTRARLWRFLQNSIS